MRALLAEEGDPEHNRLVKRSDDLADFLGQVRKKFLAYQSEFKREHSPFGGHLAELTEQLARISKDAIVDIEKSSSLLEPDF